MSGCKGYLCKVTSRGVRAPAAHSHAGELKGALVLLSVYGVRCLTHRLLFRHVLNWSSAVVPGVCYQFFQSLV